MELSKIIIKNLIIDNEYSKRVLPYIKEEYFENSSEKIIFKNIEQFVIKYSTNPTYESLYIDISNENHHEKVFEEIDATLKEIKGNRDNTNLDWLINNTEGFCQRRALHNALMQSISIFDGSDQKNDTGAIPHILEKALGVCFDSSIGHDYIEDAEDRYDYYHRTEERISTGIPAIDLITEGGFAKKTLNIYLAGPHVGKTAIMCFSAAHNLMEGKNVLYLTLEISEEEVGKRIDANLLDTGMVDVMKINRKMFMGKISRLKTKPLGKLKIKEYPTGMANVIHFKQFMNELRLKQGFVPDIIYIDYLNICASARLKMSATMTSYTYMKLVSEELRGLGIEKEFPVVTATQFNRQGAFDSNPDMDSISESFAVNFTNDFTLALITNEELRAQNKIMAKQLKNRYQDMNERPRFFLGNDRVKMRFFDTDGAAPSAPSNVVTPATFGQKKEDNNFDKFQF